MDTDSPLVKFLGRTHIVTIECDDGQAYEMQVGDVKPLRYTDDGLMIEGMHPKDSNRMIRLTIPYEKTT